MPFNELIPVISLAIALIGVALNFKNKSDSQLMRIDLLEHTSTSNAKLIDKLEKRIEKIETRDDVIIELNTRVNTLVKDIENLNKKFDKMMMKEK